MLFSRIMASLLISTLTILIIFFIRKVFKNQLSAKWRYYSWFLLFIVLTIPFVPSDWIDWINFDSHLTWDLQEKSNFPQSDKTIENLKTQESSWMQDFPISVSQLQLEPLSQIFVDVWVIGMIIMTGLIIKAWRQLTKIQQSVTRIQNPKILSLLDQCKKQFNLSQPLILGESSLITSPLTFGVFQTYVVLPKDAEKWLSMEEIKYILLHELYHVKCKDILANYLMMFYQMVYWFHPFVWMAFRQMKLDREIACDSAVLHVLDPQSYSKYGNTLIHFLDNRRSNNLALMSQLNGSKKQLKERIQRIASFRVEPTGIKWKSVMIFWLLGAWVMSQIPLFSVMAQTDSYYHFENEKVVEEDLSSYFSGYQGTFVLYDLHKDQYRIYNKEKSALRVSPNSTYKIFSALFALESHQITPDHSTLRWDGTPHPYPSWNQDQNLFTAMKYSVNWYFQQLDSQVGHDRIAAHLKQIQYGNTDVSSGLSRFWIESSLKISPMEQVQVLTAFYRNDFGFQHKNVQMVKQAIQLEEKKGKRLSGKTGTGNINGENVNGWFIGYVETQTHTYFFATHIQGDHHTSGSQAAEITKSILSDKGLF